MILKLRRRFVVAAMAALLVVVNIIALGIGYISYDRVVSVKDYLIEYIGENGGTIPAYIEDEQMTGGRRSAPYGVNITPETKFENRYFSALLDEDGRVLSVNTENIALYDDSSASALAVKLFERGKKEAIYADDDLDFFYKYRFFPRDGGTLLVMLDISSEINTLIIALALSLIIVFFVVVLFFIFVMLFSGRAVRPIVRNMEQQKQFITNAGHELKTPLAVISANTEMTEMLGGETEWTQSTRRQVERLNGLVADLITLSRLEEGGDMEKTELDFSRIVRETAGAFESIAISRGLSLEIDVRDGVKIYGDEKYVRSMVSALTDNAVKYCDDGGGVTVRLKADKKARLSVANSFAEGANVDYSRFFERFYRRDESHNSEKKGYGIGLSMAASVVEKLGGKMRVSWKDGIITFEAVI